MKSHRAQGESFQLLRRMGWWDRLSADFNRSRGTYQQYRAKPVERPLRSMTADETQWSTPPWLDMVIDIQGPYTSAEGGEQYVLAYLCTKLWVPELASLQLLQAGFFSRTLVSCVMRPWVIPDIMRSDRVGGGGNDQQSKRSISGALRSAPQQRRKRVHSLALRPNAAQPTGPNEEPPDVVARGVRTTFPQERPPFLPVLEYPYETAPRSPNWMRAFDFGASSALLSEADKLLVPSRVLHGMAQADVAVALLKKFLGALPRLRESAGRSSAEGARSNEQETTFDSNLREKGRELSAVCQP